MRVLHVHSGNLYGGVESLLLTLAEQRSTAEEMQPHFALCFHGELERRLREAGAPVHMLGEVRVSRPWSVWRSRRTLTSLLQAGAFDAVVCHSVWAQALFAPAVRACGVPSLFWLHDGARGTHWSERWAGRSRPDLAICNSRFTASTLPRLYPDCPAEVVYCPVPVPPPADPAERVRLRAELDTPADAVVIIQTSRMEAWKGHRLHLEALALMQDTPTWVCWMAGGAQRPREARYLESLRRQADALGIRSRVRFLGQRSDVGRLLSAADIHCQPNVAPEPFGIAFIEAMHAGLPVVTTALGSAKELLDDGVGTLVPPNDPAALAAVLQRLVASPELRARTVGTGRERARSISDPQHALRRLASVLGAPTTVRAGA